MVSDGWDRGDPAVLQQQVARLQRSCHRLILAEPAARHGRLPPADPRPVAALPFVDDFLPARTLRNLEDLARHLNHLPDQRPPRRSSPGSHNRVMTLEGTYTIPAPRQVSGSC